MDEPSTHLDIGLNLWFEGFGGPDRNREYGLSSTFGCSQSILSNQTLEFAVMLDQQVQDWTTYLNDKYDDSLLVMENFVDW
jgi:hypothetical protein